MKSLKPQIKRSLKDFIKKSKKSVLLLGPRQTGKSTLIKDLKPDLTINLANKKELLRFSSDPGLLDSILNQNKVKTVFIDEIQRLPSLLNTIQDIIDNWKTSPRFYLTGSSARKLKRGQANLLPGRLFLFELSGFCAREFGFELNLNKSLKYGFLPENYLTSDTYTVEKNLDMYAANYLAEEIKAEALTRNIEGFARFLNECASRSTQVLDYTKVAQQARVSRTSSLRFYEILEDTLIAERILNYEIEGIDTIKHPKLYFFDIGVVNGILNNFEASPDRIEMLFENLVYNQIRNSALALDKKIKIQYFRTRHGLEVDFIIEYNKQKIAIEVKSGHINSKDLTSLELLKKYDPTIAKFYCIGLKEKESRKIKNVNICHLNAFLKKIF